MTMLLRAFRNFRQTPIVDILKVLFLIAKAADGKKAAKARTTRADQNLQVYVGSPTQTLTNGLVQDASVVIQKTILHTTEFGDNVNILKFVALEFNVVVNQLGTVRYLLQETLHSVIQFRMT